MKLEKYPLQNKEPTIVPYVLSDGKIRYRYISYKGRAHGGELTKEMLHQIQELDKRAICENIRLDIIRDFLTNTQQLKNEQVIITPLISTQEIRVIHPEAACKITKS